MRMMMAAALAALVGSCGTTLAPRPLSAAAPQPGLRETIVSIPGPDGPLVGTLTDAGRGSPALVLVPGSGPTNRDGDNPGGVAGGVYRQLASQLAARGITTLRVDKRGMFGSKAAIPDPNKVTLDDYAADLRGWAALLKGRGHRCTFLGGHSEGGLVALVTAQRRLPGVCGLVLVAAPGRPLGSVLREQLSRQLPPAMLAPTLAAIDRMETGKTVDVATLPEPIRPIFNPAVQPFLIDLFARDPARLLASARLPALVVQGRSDLQVTMADAERLAAASPRARLVAIDGVNHVLRAAPAGDPAANAATYGNAAIPVDPRVAAGIADFIRLTK